MSAPNATDIQSRAADWLLERREGDWSEARQVELDAWLEDSLAHRIAYWRLDAAWARADLLTAMRRPAFDRRPEPPKRKAWPLLMRGAAAIIAIGTIAGAYRYFEAAAPAEKTYATAVGERERLTLADGSQIELNTDSQVRVQIAGQNRKIWLDKGEVYFAVHHNEHKPFVVMAGDRRITDIGTKFVVRRDRAAFRLAVLEGVVKLEDADAPQAPKILTKGEVAETDANRLEVTRKSQTALADALGWQRGVLIFDHTTLAGAAAEFNRYSTTKITIADPKTANLTIDGTFPSNNARAFMRLAQAVLGLKVEDRGNEVVISK